LSRGSWNFEVTSPAVGVGREVAAASELGVVAGAFDE
jgi:hypothetical protein